MKYMGSKRRIAKHILPIILKDRKPGQWYVEPFVGGANVIDKVDGPRIGFDINPYLIAFLREMRDGWIPPDEFTKEQYEEIKENIDKIEPFLVGYAAFELSFGASWFCGFRPNDPRPGRKTTAIQAKNSVLKQAPLLNGCKFNCLPYNQIEFKSESIIYCDPPYEGTTGYQSGDFNHDDFWQWCRDRYKDGHQIFISEYQSPDDFVSVWEKEQKTSLNNKSDHKKATERLFVPRKA